MESLGEDLPEAVLGSDKHLWQKLLAASDSSGNKKEISVESLQSWQEGQQLTKMTEVIFGKRLVPCTLLLWLYCSRPRLILICFTDHEVLLGLYKGTIQQPC